MVYLSTMIKGGYIANLDLSEVSLPDNTFPAEWAENATGLQSSVFPKTTLTFGYHAFAGSGLTALSFEGCTSATFNAKDANVTTHGTFQGCTSLTTADLSALTTLMAEGGTEYEHAIAKEMFQGCTALTTVTLPGNTTVIDESAFQDCTALTSINTGSVNLFGAHSFQGCTSLPNPNLISANTLGYQAFKGCSSITDPNMRSQSITSMGDEAFADCSSLHTLVLPKNNSLTTIPVGMAYNCPNLENVTIYNQTTTISYRAFQNCSKLANITFENPGAITFVGPCAFDGCTALDNDLDGLSGVKTIGWSSFNGCTNLSEQAIATILASITGGVAHPNDGSSASHVTAGLIPSDAFHGCSKMGASPLGTAIAASTVWSGQRWMGYSTAYTNYQDAITLDNRANPNIAKGCTAYCDQPVYRDNKALAFDGIISDASRWDAYDYYWDSSLNDGKGGWQLPTISCPFYLYVDLGVKRKIGEVKLYWENSYAAKYTLMTSDNAINWETQKTETDTDRFSEGGTEFTRDETTDPVTIYYYYLDDINLSDVAARYVKVQVDELRSGCSAASLYEFEVYGPTIATIGTSVIDDLVDKIPEDGNGHKWYEEDYDVTTRTAQTSVEGALYSYPWTQQTAPFSDNGNNWGFNDDNGFSENIPLLDNAADIFIRREFTYTGPTDGTITLTWGHDDSPCLYYLNGHLLASANTSESDAATGNWDGSRWWTAATHVLTDTEKTYLHADGTTNVLAFYVHQDWGGCAADCGLYIDNPDETSRLLLNDGVGDNYGWQCVYTTVDTDGDAPAADSSDNVWTAVAYNELEWTAGFGGFGDANAKSTYSMSTEWPENYDIYLRRHVYLTENDLADLSDHVYNVRYTLDDTMDMYLNGNLIYTVNNKWQSNPTNWATLSLTDAQKNYLQAGDNVFAVKLHNASGGRMFDFAFEKQTHTIDLSTNSNITTVGANAFNSCTALETLDLGTATTFNNGAFAGDSRLRTVTVHNASAPTLGENALPPAADISNTNYVQVVFEDDAATGTNYQNYRSDSQFMRLLTKTLDESASYYDAAPQMHADVQLKRTFAHGWNTLALPFGSPQKNGTTQVDGNYLGDDSYFRDAAELVEEAICGLGTYQSTASGGYYDHGYSATDDDRFVLAVYRGLRTRGDDPDNYTFTFLEFTEDRTSEWNLSQSELDEFEPILVWVPQRIIDAQTSETVYTFKNVDLNYDAGTTSLYQPYQLPGSVASTGIPFYGAYNTDMNFFSGNDYAHYRFNGVYSTKMSDVHPDFITTGDYFIQSNKFYRATADKKYRLKGFRGWFHKTADFAVASAAPAWGLATFKLEGDETLTPIETLDGASLRPEPFDVYSLGGQLVRKGVLSTAGLPKGMYVIRGHKVVVK